jgi:hypothetical protein
MTTKQLFAAAADEADRILRREMPSIEKVLNRLDVYTLLEMQHALAQQFVVMLRHAAESRSQLHAFPLLHATLKRVEIPIPAKAITTQKV